MHIFIIYFFVNSRVFCWVNQIMIFRYSLHINNLFYLHYFFCPKLSIGTYFKTYKLLFYRSLFIFPIFGDWRLYFVPYKVMFYFAWQCSSLAFHCSSGTPYSLVSGKTEYLEFFFNRDLLIGLKKCCKLCRNSKRFNYVAN